MAYALVYTTFAIIQKKCQCQVHQRQKGKFSSLSANHFPKLKTKTKGKQQL